MKKFYSLFSSLCYYFFDDRKAALVAGSLTYRLLISHYLQVTRLPITAIGFVAGHALVNPNNCYEYSKNSGRPYPF